MQEMGSSWAFSTPLEKYPNCQAEGAVDENDIGVAFEALYDMRFYNGPRVHRPLPGLV